MFVTVTIRDLSQLLATLHVVEAESLQGQKTSREEHNSKCMGLLPRDHLFARLLKLSRYQELVQHPVSLHPGRLSGPLTSTQNFCIGLYHQCCIC